MVFFLIVAYPAASKLSISRYGHIQAASIQSTAAATTNATTTDAAAATSTATTSASATAGAAALSDYCLFLCMQKIFLLSNFWLYTMLRYILRSCKMFPRLWKIMVIIFWWHLLFYFWVCIHWSLFLYRINIWWIAFPVLCSGSSMVDDFFSLSFHYDVNQSLSLWLLPCITLYCVFSSEVG